jgi:hypothetical protein
VERSRRDAAVLDFFDSIDWPRHEARLAHDLPLRAYGRLHAAYGHYDPAPYDGMAELVLSERGRGAGPASPVPVLYDSVDHYLARWRELTGGLRLHDSGADHLSMAGPRNAPDLAALCERLTADAEGTR